MTLSVFESSRLFFQVLRHMGIHVLSGNNRSGQVDCVLMIKFNWLLCNVCPVADLFDWKLYTKAK